MYLTRYIIKLNFLFRQSLKNKRITSKFLLILSIVATFTLYFLLRWNNDPLSIEKPFIFIEPLTSYYRFKHSRVTKDWHDYKAIERESKRSGVGEQGAPAYVTKDEEELSRKSFEENKHNGLVSDKIARDRSIPDTRPKQCQTRKYLSDLPSVSVVIPFNNEILSTLTRTIHSVFNRSPPELLKEVIIVNDHSDKEHTYGPLEEYAINHFDLTKLRILVMPVRSGLMWARLAGARAASGDVIVFMDCHTEANVNWLPSLVEPIAKNYRACVCPFIDYISPHTYQYEKSNKKVKGAFNWHFKYQELPLQLEEGATEDESFQTPIMQGSVFAISAKFFWELGGYDTGLDIWGGEQFELSFKVWLCGGELLDAPCSRIGHLHKSVDETEIELSSKRKNIKRIAQIWMDKYEEYVYDKNPDEWNEIETGDLSYMLGVKKNLNCKPFKHFLEEVAPDMLDRYPYIEPPAFAFGGIQNVADPNLCIDTNGARNGRSVGIDVCSGSLANPRTHQTFRLRNHRDISIVDTYSDCLEADDGKVVANSCTFKQGRQYFRYSFITKQIHSGRQQAKNCLDIDLRMKELFIAECSIEKNTQKWNWGMIDVQMLTNWKNSGKPIIDEIEMEEE